MRLIIVTQDFPPALGGVQSYALELGRRLAMRTRDLLVIAPGGPDAAAFDRALGFDVLRVRRGPLFWLRLHAALPREARRRASEAVLCAQWMTASPALRARRNGRLRRVFVAAHGRELRFIPFGRNPAVARVYRRLRRAALREADLVFPVSHFTAGLAADLGVRKERLCVVTNGTSPERFRPLDASALRRELGISEQAPVLLSVARLRPHKGIDSVIGALPTLRARLPGLVYLVAGRGPDRARLARLAAQGGVASAVRFLDAVGHAELPLLYNACDAFVLASRENGPDVEGFGIALLEAQACGKPVVATRSGGMGDAVADGQSGLLVEPGDSDALAGALLRVLQDRDLGRALGIAGRERVIQEASWELSAERLLGAMRERLGTACAVPESGA